MEIKKGQVWENKQDSRDVEVAFIDGNKVWFTSDTWMNIKTFKDRYYLKDPTFKSILNSICNMVEAKDKAYGNSALKPLDIFAKHHNYGSRLDEKLARIKNCDELKKNDVADIIGGLVLICKDKNWTNFEDLID